MSSLKYQIFEKCINYKNDISEIIKKLNIKNKKKFMKYSIYLLEVLKGNLKRSLFKKCNVILSVSCLTCRKLKIPYFLNDFSKIFNINVFDLGSSFVRIMKILNLQSNFSHFKNLDPSLYITRYVNKLNFGKHTSKISKLAIEILNYNKEIFRTKHYWKQGIFGAAIYLSAIAYGFKTSPGAINRAINLNINTLNKRIKDFIKNSTLRNKSQITKFNPESISKTCPKYRTPTEKPHAIERAHSLLLNLIPA
uniref:TFIIIB related factor hBRF n=1 Tax=Amorphochlora amoebiformis TaxID=1561963 RepID=A0A0H5BM10_9EUKA|nr:TFIIIB related factor hBRF [Amorphochlora amoebiformis]